MLPHPVDSEEVPPESLPPMKKEAYCRIYVQLSALWLDLSANSECHGSEIAGACHRVHHRLFPLHFLHVGSDLMLLLHLGLLKGRRCFEVWVLEVYSEGPRLPSLRHLPIQGSH